MLTLILVKVDLYHFNKEEKLSHRLLEIIFELISHDLYLDCPYNDTEAQKERVKQFRDCLNEQYSKSAQEVIQYLKDHFKDKLDAEVKSEFLDRFDEAISARIQDVKEMDKHLFNMWKHEPKEKTYKWITENNFKERYFYWYISFNELIYFMGRNMLVKQLYNYIRTDQKDTRYSRFSVLMDIYDEMVDEMCKDKEGGDLIKGFIN